MKNTENKEMILYVKGWGADSTLNAKGDITDKAKVTLQGKYCDPVTLEEIAIGLSLTAESLEILEKHVALRHGTTYKFVLVPTNKSLRNYEIEPIAEEIPA